MTTTAFRRTTESSAATPRAWTRLLPGLALSGALAAAGVALGRIGWLQDHGFSALTLAIVLGMIVGNTVYPLVPRLAAAAVPASTSPSRTCCAWAWCCTACG